MRIFTHLSLEGFSNTYVLGPDQPGPAVVIDPGSMDGELLNMFLQNGYEPKQVLITRDERHHSGGLRTLRKIFDVSVFGLEETDFGVGSSGVGAMNGGNGVGGVNGANGNDNGAEDLIEHHEFSVAGFEIHAVYFPGSWIDGHMYLVNGLLFPGAMFSAGEIRAVPAGYPQALLVESLLMVLKSLPPSTYVFPAYGPPTTIRAELRTNPALHRPPQLPPEEADL